MAELPATTSTAHSSPSPGLLSLESFITNYPSAAVLLDPSYIVQLASDKFLKDYGLLSCEVLGRPIFDTFNEFQLIPDAETLRLVIDMARSTGKVYITTDIQGYGGSFWSVRSNPIIENGVLVNELLSIHETTAEHQERHATTDQIDINESYRVLVDQVKDYAIFILDPVGKVKTWNVGAQLLKGYTAEEIVGQHFSVFYLPEDIVAGKPQKELEIALAEGRVEDESLRIKKDGSTFLANVIITPMYREGRHIGFSKVTRDLTERKAAENRIIEAYKESEKMKTDFLANMSHEIRTPLHGLLASLDELFATGGLTQDQKEAADDMKESGRYLIHVIGGILDYSKLESGNFSLKVSTINLRSISSAVVLSLKYLVKPGVLFQSTCDSNVPESLKGDPDSYQQILQNLAANALKFTEAGSVFIHTSIESEDTFSYTILTTVTDTGIGISADEASVLFKRFSQADNSLTKKYKGTGLGLVICKGLVELMEGTISYHPNPNTNGSVFKFTTKLAKLHAKAPLCETEDQMDALTLSRLPPLPRTSLMTLAPKKRILLAEDNKLNQKVAVKLLNRLGFHYIDTVVNGADAVEKAKENRLIYDAILMDVSMPIMDGKQATKEIRLAGIGIPIIAMTANALKSDVDEYLEIGMNGYVSKPVNTDLLVEVLLTWLK